MDCLTTSELTARLRALARYPLALLPTPLHPLPRLSKHVGGPEIWVKRDDLTGLAFGGNKVRQMEYFVGAALEGGADVLIGGGGYAQSNHARVCSAAARAAGLRPLVVVRPGGIESSGKGHMGNALVTRLLCEDIRYAETLDNAPTDRLEELAARQEVFCPIAEEVRASGHNPYVILGTSVGLGAMGYVTAAMELQSQFEEADIKPDWVVVTSLGVTQAGLELGSRLLGLPWRVCGMAYMPANGTGSRTVAKLVNDASLLLDAPLRLDGNEVMNLDSAAGPAYAVPSRASADAMKLAAVSEGLILDPVYTSKGMAGLIAASHHGALSPKELVVFIHTGGQPAMFAHSDGDLH